MVLCLLDGRVIGTGAPVYIIAELGQNHQGDPVVAEQLIRAAAAAGADCVKLQRSSLEHKFTAAALERSYFWRQQLWHHIWQTQVPS